MFLRRRTSETFFIGRAVRPRREEALGELTRLLEGEGGLRQLKTALSDEISAGKMAEMSDEDVVLALASGVAAGRYVLIGYRPRPAASPTFAAADGPEGEALGPEAVAVSVIKAAQKGLSDLETLVAKALEIVALIEEIQVEAVDVRVEVEEALAMLDMAQVRFDLGSASLQEIPASIDRVITSMGEVASKTLKAIDEL